MNPDRPVFAARFDEDYTKLFGIPVDGMDVEITVWSVNATTPTPPVERIAQTQGLQVAATSDSRKIFDAASGGYLDAPVAARGQMQAGHRACGPAATTEAQTTIIVPASRDAICQPDGCIDIVMKGAS